MLRIKEKQPYYILPTQRYDLTTLPPSKVMQEDFTFFVTFNKEKNVQHTETPSAVMMRPGMHYGLSYNQQSGHINWEFWTKVGEEAKHDFVTFFTEPYSLEQEWTFMVRHNLDEKSFEMTVVNPEGGKQTQIREYEGVLWDYSGTPYNFGCGNYFKMVDDSHYFWGDYTLHQIFLLNTSKFDSDILLKFSEDNKDAVTTLKKTINNLVFYFNFNKQNQYKVWDLSEHCNFLMKNLDVGKG